MAWKGLKTPSITYKEEETYFTAVLELGDMFDGGGVPIDHYIIQLDNGTQLETPDPTHSFDIMDNNPLYEMRIMSNERHSHKTAGPHVYETVDNVAV